jgi:hypothetical protein
LKLVDPDRRIVLERHLGYGLAEIAIVMNNLLERESVL